MNGLSLNGHPSTWIWPRESNDAVPVNVQDQTSPAFDLYFVNELGANTLAVAGAIDATTLTLVSAAGFAAGSFLGIFQSGRYYFASVISVAVNVLTVDTPLDYAFTIGAPVVRLDRDLNKNGTLGAPVTFQIQGPTIADLQVDITRFMLAMETSTTPSLTQFGDLTALTNGLVLRKKDTVYRNIWNVKTNYDLGLHAYDFTSFSTLGPGGEGLLLRYSFAGPEKHGVAIRLGQGESLELLVQDGLSGLVKFRALAEGHEVFE